MLRYCFMDFLEYLTPRCYTGDSLYQKTFMENYKKCVNTGQHITVKMVMWLPVFLRL